MRKERTFEIITPSGKTLIMSGGIKTKAAKKPITLTPDIVKRYLGGQIIVINLSDLSGHGENEGKLFYGQISGIKLIDESENTMLSIKFDWCYTLNQEFERVPYDRSFYNLPLKYCRVEMQDQKVYISQEEPVFSPDQPLMVFDETKGDDCLLIPAGHPYCTDPYDLKKLME